MRWTVALLFLLLPGCTGDEAVTEVPVDAGLAPAPLPPTDPVVEPVPAARAEPVVFQGRVLIVDPLTQLWPMCFFPYVVPQDTHAGGDQFDLEGNYSGWAFAFDVDGMVARFSVDGDWSQTAREGRVPEGADRVNACSESAVNTAYTLTISPPVPPLAPLTSVEFLGQVMRPDPTGDDCWGGWWRAWLGTGPEISGNLFKLEGNFTGWSFSFDVDGMVARFSGRDGGLGPWAAAGTVPAEATVVHTCSRSASDADYTLSIRAPAS